MRNAIIIYETKKGATQLMAETIEASLRESGVNVILKRIFEVDVTELADYACVILGSPTFNKDMAGSMKAFLLRLEKENLKGKVGASFGAYGWSGEAVELLSRTMKNIFGMDVIEPEVKLPGTAGGVDRAEYLSFGKTIAAKMKDREK